VKSAAIAALHRLRSFVTAALHRLRSFATATYGRLRSFATTHPRAAALTGAVLLVILALAAFLVLRSGSETVTVEPTTTTTTTTEPPTTTTTEPPPPVAPLTGLTGDFGDRLDRPALFVKIDNVERARPHAGLTKADIVIEEPVEGNLTRLVAVFHSTDADNLGPVRSMRTTDLELVPLFGRPLFASSGGNAGVVPQIQAANVVDIGQNVSNEGFRRSGARPAPHNLFTSTTGLYGKAPELPPPPEPVFSYLDEGEALAEGAIPVGGVALRFGGPEVSRFTWHPETRTWARTQRGTPHVDVDGHRLAPTNVVVAEIDYDLSNQLGRSVPHGVVTGEGRVVVLTQGQAIQGTWSRPTLADPLRLVADSGDPIELTPGQTFLEFPVRGGWDFI
jgi:hypothetical protein